MKADYSLYLVTDRANICGGAEMKVAENITNGFGKTTPANSRLLCSAVEKAILGGCTMVQLREKNISSKEFYYLAEEVKQVTDKYRVPLIINDRIDIALSVEAAGVHIGQKDIPVPAARKMIGKNMLLGVSAVSVCEAVRAWKDGADYLGVGAMFPTKTKSDARRVTIEELEKIRKAVPLPIVAIGGIGRENAGELMALGIDGVAVVSAILSQPDIRKAAAELRKLVMRKGLS